MRRIIFSFALFLTCHLLYAQKTVTPGELTVVFAISDDGFLNVREKPSSKGKILTTLPMCFHGLGRGILLESGERWSKIVVDNIVGWVYNKYLGYQSWYSGEGKTRLVAKNSQPPYTPTTMQMMVLSIFLMELSARVLSLQTIMNCLRMVTMSSRQVMTISSSIRMTLSRKIIAKNNLHRVKHLLFSQEVEVAHDGILHGRGS